MILLLFVLGLIACILIARYNEDDRLFWKLTLSMVFAFTATAIAIKATGGKQDKTALIEQVYPTQESIVMPGTCMPIIGVNNWTAVGVIKTTVPASQDNTPAYSEPSCSEEICDKTRDQPPGVLNNKSLFEEDIGSFTIDSS